MNSKDLAETNERIAGRDRAVLWHPCTQMKDHEQGGPLPIRRARGVWLEDFEGRRYLDAISSWWVNLFGHSHPSINAALREQAETLEHVILAGFSHLPAIELAERLTALAPPGLTRCFYADSGSAAVEVALKMSYHYWRNRGQSGKTRFITLENGYHGETLGALAVGGLGLYRDTYGPLLMETLRVPSPDCYGREPGESEHDYTRRRFEAMRETLERHHQEVCAVIVEPLVQCAGSMRMYEPVYLELLREACDRYGVHLIADEIAVGFGRTGTMFACEQAGITPDFLCLSKGLTGGYLPLSAVLTGEDIYQAFYGEYAEMKAFLHSHSYTGNALGCRAALATLDLFAASPVLEYNRELAAVMGRACERFLDHPHVAEVRQRGMILAIETVRERRSREPWPWQERRGRRIARRAQELGVLLRPLGDVVYFMPPYVITPEEIEQMADAAWAGINAAAED
ncbi:MAG: adenosylmethionine--8-amino-7-oxononanoate transaminase [Gammaproteobacteria bacterium]|jgi:adenosylmethionine-8-amino-7-oxononanoate aminotransferase|nr:adenosylmethionine--8-amino-7-oxononanoate transaminase [Gammaproteobacteria bacterium]